MFGWLVSGKEALDEMFRIWGDVWCGDVASNCDVALK